MKYAFLFVGMLFLVASICIIMRLRGWPMVVWFSDGAPQPDVPHGEFLVVTDAEIQQLVDQLYDEEDHEAVRRLSAIGPRVAPFLIDALKKEETYQKEFGGFLPQSPCERICHVLGALQSRAAVEPLETYLNHPNWHFRQAAALAIGSIGSVECIAPIKQALQDEDDTVRNQAMLGILRAIDSNHCETDFLNGVFPSITSLLDNGKRSDGRKAAETILAIDTDRAMSMLISPGCFSPDNPQIDHVIKAINKSGRKIPHGVLRSFLGRVRPLIEEYPYDYAYAEALIAYAHNPDSNAEAILRSALSSTNEKIQASAAEGLGILLDITSAKAVVLEAEERLGFDSLPLPQSFFVAIIEYDGEVRNGGHSQYFMNPSGLHWRTAIQGLEEIGAPTRASILRSAVQLFRPHGLGGTDAIHSFRLSSMTEKQRQALERLNQEYYLCDENVKALLAMYTLSHRDFFVPKK